MNKSPVIELRSVAFAYDRKTILDGADLKVYPSDFLSVVGPNGSGKSTLIKIMLGLLKPQKGKVLLFGQDTNCFNQWHRIGYLSQKATTFNPTFPATVREVVGIHAGTRRGLVKRMTARDWERVDAALEKVGLADQKNSLVGRLSGGQQQRVFLARILVNQPEVLLLDEPLVGIDAAAQEYLQSLLEDLHSSQKLTIIMVTHDITYASQTATRLVCIHHHRIFEHNPLDYTESALQQRSITQLYHFH